MNKKTCTKCNEDKALDCFDKHSKSKDGLCPKCKDCRKAYWQEYISKPENQKRHRERSRKRAAINRKEIFEFVRQLKEGQPCLDCDNSYPYYVMHYDHLDDKVENVSVLKSQGATKKRILKEIAKCELVCANCHAERTHQRRIESCT